MLKKVIGIITILGIIAGIIYLIVNNNKKEKVISPYNTFKHDLLCISSGEEEKDEMEHTYTSNVYLEIKNDLVTKATYQTISNNNYGSLYNVYKDILNMYENITGITYNLYNVDNEIVSEITYDYNKIDLKEIKSKLSNLLDETSLLMGDNIPINYNEFIKKELDGYICE